MYLPNWRDKTKVLVYENDNWNLRDRTGVLNEIKDNGIDYIQKKYEELDEDNPKDEIIIKKLKRFLTKYNDGADIPDLDDDIMLILYNNRHFVKK